MDKTHIEPVDTKEKNLTLRFRLFAVAWLLGAITCFSPLVFLPERYSYSVHCRWRGISFHGNFHLEAE